MKLTCCLEQKAPRPRKKKGAEQQDAHVETKRLHDDLIGRCRALHLNHGPIPRWAF